MKAIPYQITVSYSADDEGYVARVPALRYCLAFGETPEKAVKEVKTAAAAMLKVMEEEGKPLPALDTTLATTDSPPRPLIRHAGNRRRFQQLPSCASAP